MFIAAGLAVLFSSLVAGLAALVLMVERARLGHQMQERAEQRTSLLHAATFELRQHLTSLSGLLQYGSAEAHRRDDLQCALKEVNAALVDVLEVFDANVGHLTIEREPLELRSEVLLLIRRMNKRFEKRAQAVVIEAGYTPECWIEADPVRIRQCISTLLEQAAEQTGQGRIRLSFRVEATHGAQRLVTFLIKDGGPGMTQDEAALLFNPMEYSKSSVLKGRPAAMLSLNLTREIAEAMGGTVSAHSKEGAGTSYFFSLRAETCPPLHDDAEDDLDTNDQVSFEALSVLLVDDNPLNLFVLEEAVVPMGFRRVVSVGGGQAAINRAREEAFDLVLMDLTMPGVDGYRAAAEIRQAGASSGAQIVAVSADHRAGCSPDLLEVGIRAFVPKPIVTSQLLAAMLKVLPAGPVSAEPARKAVAAR